MFTSVHAQQLEDFGYCVIEQALDAQKTGTVRQALLGAVAESERRGIPTYIPNLDPNPSNTRVFNLLDLDPVFLELITHPLAIQIVGDLLENDFIVSNFTANIARSGSQSMVLHSDLSVVLPEPWHAMWSVNAIWCLDDVYAENGATLYLPGSHHIERRDQLPEDIEPYLEPMQASAGSLVVMDGRLWHTSGRNTTEDQERALLFGYYSRSFIRPQWNFSVALSDSTKQLIGPELHHWLGLGINANVKPLDGLL
ncbi:MAG: phytanoyl-CoA dioxygenase family protein [Pseudomonadota bacterium]